MDNTTILDAHQVELKAYSELKKLGSLHLGMSEQCIKITGLVVHGDGIKGYEFMELLNEKAKENQWEYLEYNRMGLNDYTVSFIIRL